MYFIEKHIESIEKQLKSSDILIIGSDETEINFIKTTLEKESFSKVSIAYTCHEALKTVEISIPDLIILDMVTQELDGYQTCLKLRSNSKTQHIPIIAKINCKSHSKKKKAFALGINDFLSTPALEIEILTRVKMHLSQSKLFKSLVEFQERLNFELEEARKMLLSLISKDNVHSEISKRNNLSIASYYKTSEELGGDYYAIKEMDDGLVASYIWDFSGHGIRAAINTFRLHSLIQSITGTQINPAEFLNEINSYLFTMLSRDQFATMFYCLIDIPLQKLTYAATGTPCPYLVSFKHSKVKKLDSTGFPLGIIDNPRYKNHIIDFTNWDLIIFYSDALIETKNRDNILFNLSNFLKNLATSTQDIPSSNISNWLLEKIIFEFDKSYAFNLKDDLTICIISKV